MVSCKGHTSEVMVEHSRRVGLVLVLHQKAKALSLSWHFFKLSSYFCQCHQSLCVSSTFAVLPGEEGVDNLLYITFCSPAPLWGGWKDMLCLFTKFQGFLSILRCRHRHSNIGCTNSTSFVASVMRMRTDLKGNHHFVWQWLMVHKETTPISLYYLCRLLFDLVLHFWHLYTFPRKLWVLQSQWYGNLHCKNEVCWSARLDRMATIRTPLGLVWRSGHKRASECCYKQINWLNCSCRVKGCHTLTELFVEPG